MRKPHSIFRLSGMKLVISCLLMLALAPAALAQFDTATVLGTVTDSTGAAIASARTRPCSTPGQADRGQ